MTILGRLARLDRRFLGRRVTRESPRRMRVVNGVIVGSMTLLTAYAGLLVAAGDRLPQWPVKAFGLLFVLALLSTWHDSRR